jgi:hypothetical protein
MMLLIAPLVELYRMLNILDQAKPTLYRGNGVDGFSFVRLQSPSNLGKQKHQRNH